MRTAAIGLAMAALALAGCELKVGKEKKDDDSASISIGAQDDVSLSRANGSEGVSIDVPGFGAKINVPGMEIGDTDMEISGMTLYPGTRFTAIAVSDKTGKDNGLVDMRFTSPGMPDQIVAHYAAAARGKGFSDIKTTHAGGKATFSAKEPDGDRVTIEADPAKSGSAGRILLRSAAG